MDFLILVFYLSILFFFIINSIINIYTIEKQFNVNKPPSLLENIIDIKYQSKNQ